MAGTPSGFSADAVRAGLRTAMEFGAPEDTTQQATFYTETAASTTDPADEEGVPFNPTAAITKTSPTSVQVDCAITYLDSSGKLDAFGYVTPDSVHVTLLDQDYAKVAGFNYVVINGNRFDYRKTLNPEGLGPITIYTVVCEAVDVA